MSFCLLIILGHMTREMEARTLPSGKVVARSCVAVNRRWRDAAGREQSHADFIDVEAFSDVAKDMIRNVEKGSKVFLSGRMQQDRWEGPDKHMHIKVKMIVEEFSLLSGEASAQATLAEAERAPAAETLYEEKVDASARVQ